jgi:hypothetical protein
MLHAHCYARKPENSPCIEEFKTENPVPCGALEEVDEILSAIDGQIKDNTRLAIINLVGHGCILMASDVSYFIDLMQYKDNCFIKRSVPEQFNKRFREDLFDIFRKRTPNIKFENNPIDISTFSELVCTADEDSLGMVQDEYCCHGSLFNCWEEPFGVGIWGATRRQTNNTIIETYKEYLTNHPDRIYVAKCSGKTYVAISARDIDKCDYRIYV